MKVEEQNQELLEYLVANGYTKFGFSAEYLLEQYSKSKKASPESLTWTSVTQKQVDYQRGCWDLVEEIKKIISIVGACDIEDLETIAQKVSGVHGRS